MSTFIHRYEIDQSRPPAKQFWRDVAVRAIVPAIVLGAVIVGVGFLITGPLDNLPSEHGVNTWFVEQRNATMNQVTHVISQIGNTPIAVSICIVMMLILLWRTRQWWFALIPGLAMGLQALIFLSSSLIVGRPRPEVDHLDSSPPTTSYPSGHVGASTALYVSLALVAQRIQHRALRVVVTILLLLCPLTMATARLYRGMHSLSDVLAALVNGTVCAFIAWNYLRRDTSSGRSPAPAKEAAAQNA